MQGGVLTYASLAGRALASEASPTQQIEPLWLHNVVELVSKPEQHRQVPRPFETAAAEREVHHPHEHLDQHMLRCEAREQHLEVRQQPGRIACSDEEFGRPRRKRLRVDESSHSRIELRGRHESPVECQLKAAGEVTVRPVGALDVREQDAHVVCASHHEHVSALRAACGDRVDDVLAAAKRAADAFVAQLIEEEEVHWIALHQLAALDCPRALGVLLAMGGACIAEQLQLVE